METVAIIIYTYSPYTTSYVHHLVRRTISIKWMLSPMLRVVNVSFNIVFCDIGRPRRAAGIETRLRHRHTRPRVRPSAAEAAAHPTWPTILRSAALFMRLNNKSPRSPSGS